MGPVSLPHDQSCGMWNSNYIYRSVHNTRIERLWVDYTTQLGSKWADFFIELELHHFLDADNINHIWLLQYLFLVDLNQEIQVFVETWNNHLLRHDGERTHSPLDRFQWDMQTLGLRGDLLPAGLCHTFYMPTHLIFSITDVARAHADSVGRLEQETYGVDWATFREPAIVRSHLANNPITEESTPWLGPADSPPPERMNSVTVEPPSCDLSSEDVMALFNYIHPYLNGSSLVARMECWDYALAYAQECSSLF